MPVYVTVLSVFLPVCNLSFFLVYIYDDWTTTNASAVSWFPTFSFFANQRQPVWPVFNTRLVAATANAYMIDVLAFDV